MTAGGSSSVRPVRIALPAHEEDRPPSPELLALLQLLHSFGRVARMYPSWHERIARHKQRLAAAAREVFRSRRDPLRIESAGEGLVVEGAVLTTAPSLARVLAAAFAQHGIRAVTFVPGVEPEEVLAVAELLSIPVREFLERGGLTAFLKDRYLAHVNFLLQPGFAEREPAPHEERGPAAAQEEAPASQSAPVQQASQAEEREEEEPDEELFAAILPAGLRRRAEEAVRSRIRTHVPDGNAALALCRLLLGAQDSVEYGRRRELLLRVLKARLFPEGRVQEALGHLLRELGRSPSHEDPTFLLLDLSAAVRDPELPARAQGLLPFQVEAARSFVREVESREDGFDTLLFLARASLPEGARVGFFEELVRAIRRRPRAFQRWALAHRRELMAPAVFAELLQREPVVVSAVAKEILLDRRAVERHAMIRLLTAIGNEVALRVLALGLRYGDEPRDPELLRALSRFARPLAVHLLIEAVHRCNVGPERPEEAEAALRALARSPLQAARVFLDRVLTERRLGWHLYRPYLRRLAAAVLEEEA